MIEEKKIEELFGKDNHFEVPAGYFDNLTARIMDELLVEQEARIISIQSGHSWWQGAAVRKIAAAVAVVFVLGGSVVMGLQQGEKKHQQMAQSAACENTNAKVSDEEAFNQMADYAMMDNQDFYASLVAEN